MFAAKEANPDLLFFEIVRDPKNHGIKHYTPFADDNTPLHDLKLGTVRQYKDKPPRMPKPTQIATFGPDGVFKYVVPEDKSAIFYTSDPLTGMSTSSFLLSNCNMSWVICRQEASGTRCSQKCIGLQRPF